MIVSVASGKGGTGKTSIACALAQSAENRIPILLKIPFDRGIAEAYSRGISIVDKMPEYREHFKALFRAISDKLLSVKT